MSSITLTFNKIIRQSSFCQKKLGLLVAKNNKGSTKGLLVDGDVKRANQKFKNLHDLKVKDIMTKNPLSVPQNMLAVQSLSIMNNKRITSLLIHKNKNKNKTIGIVHIHNVLQKIG